MESKVPFQRKRKTKDPCEKCFLHRDLCICSLIPILDLKTKLVLVIHHRELKRTTNTGRLAIHALKNSQMFVRGEGREALDLRPVIDGDYESLLLYPSEDAIELSEIVSRPRRRPIQLIVPDGNWRQASKVAIRHPELVGVQRVKITSKNTAEQHLRKEHFEEGLSTLEAIAQAFALIEGAEAGSALSALYQAKLSATLKGRGSGQFMSPQKI